MSATLLLDQTDFKKFHGNTAHSSFFFAVIKSQQKFCESSREVEIFGKGGL